MIKHLVSKGGDPVFLDFVPLLLWFGILLYSAYLLFIKDINLWYAAAYGLLLVVVIWKEAEILRLRFGKEKLIEILLGVSREEFE